MVEEDRESLTGEGASVDLELADEGSPSEVGVEEVVDGESLAAAEDPEKEIERLRAECAELRDAYLRVRADFENSRRRMEREKSDYYRYALAGAVRELLPVFDNLDRALSMAADREDDFIQGVRMIHSMLDDVLSKLGVTPVGRVGEPFDPNYHEAVAREDRTDVPSHTVLDVLQKGYVLDERLIRPAMVRVAVGNERTSAEPGDGDEPAGELGDEG